MYQSGIQTSSIDGVLPFVTLFDRRPYNYSILFKGVGRMSDQLRGFDAFMRALSNNFFLLIIIILFFTAWNSSSSCKKQKRVAMEPIPDTIEQEMDSF
jgi:uncharacterized membrane protein